MGVVAERMIKALIVFCSFNNSDAVKDDLTNVLTLFLHFDNFCRFLCDC